MIIDDYEEGTFTYVVFRKYRWPIVSRFMNWIRPTRRDGHYTRIGNTVHVEITEPLPPITQLPFNGDDVTYIVKPTTPQQ